MAGVTKNVINQIFQRICYQISILGSELYPTEIRTQATGITKSFKFLLACSAALVFLPMKRYIHLFGVFYYFTAISGICTIWGYMTIPETRGKSLVKIEELYDKKSTTTS